MLSRVPLDKAALGHEEFVGKATGEETVCVSCLEGSSAGA